LISFPFWVFLTSCLVLRVYFGENVKTACENIFNFRALQLQNALQYLQCILYTKIIYSAVHLLMAPSLSFPPHRAFLQRPILSRLDLRAHSAPSIFLWPPPSLFPKWCRPFSVRFSAPPPAPICAQHFLMPPSLSFPAHRAFPSAANSFLPRPPSPFGAQHFLMAPSLSISQIMPSL